MGHLSASYQIVYFQPDPEDGERVSVALLFAANGDVDLLYDPEFRRLRCLSPQTDPSLVRFYLNDLASALSRKKDLDTLMLERSPHLVTSAKRKVTWPLTDKLRLQLIERFLNKGSAELPMPVMPEARSEKIDEVQEHLRRLVTANFNTNVGRVLERAKPEFVLGRKVPQIKPVAFAIFRGNRVTLLDGVDLNAVSPTKAVTRVGRVAYIFFQYGRERQFITDRPITRVGVVLNGAKRPTAAQRDAHDFALREFSQEADLAIDTSSPEQVERLKKELALQ